MRTYNAEGRMTSTVNGINSSSYYTYDADGRRTRRHNCNEAAVWQVYGFDSELLAEYASHNEVTIFSGAVNGYGAQVPFSVTRTVAAGDTVEFSVGRGANGTYDSDSTGLAATIKAQGGQAELNWLVTDPPGHASC